MDCGKPIDHAPKIFQPLLPSKLSNAAITIILSLTALHRSNILYLQLPPKFIQIFANDGKRSFLKFQCDQIMTDTAQSLYPGRRVEFGRAYENESA